MQYRIELALHLEADSADEVRQIAEEAMKVGGSRAEDLCAEATMTRGEPVPVAPPTARPTMAFDARASAC